MSVALGDMVGGGMPGLCVQESLQCWGWLGQDSFQESLESVTQRDNTNVATKDEAVHRCRAGLRSRPFPLCPFTGSKWVLCLFSGQATEDEVIC